MKKVSRNYFLTLFDILFFFLFQKHRQIRGSRRILHGIAKRIQNHDAPPCNRCRSLNLKFFIDQNLRKPLPNHPSSDNLLTCLQASTHLTIHFFQIYVLCYYLLLPRSSKTPKSRGLSSNLLPVKSSRLLIPGVF